MLGNDVCGTGGQYKNVVQTEIEELQRLQTMKTLLP
jgi:hypothetical protein